MDWHLSLSLFLSVCMTTLSWISQIYSPKSLVIAILIVAFYLQFLLSLSGVTCNIPKAQMTVAKLFLFFLFCFSHSFLFYISFLPDPFFLFILPFPSLSLYHHLTPETTQGPTSMTSISHIKDPSNISGLCPYHCFHQPFLHQSTSFRPSTQPNTITNPNGNLPMDFVQTILTWCLGK